VSLFPKRFLGQFTSTLIKYEGRHFPILVIDEVNLATSVLNEEACLRLSHQIGAFSCDQSAPYTTYARRNESIGFHPMNDADPMSLGRRQASTE
jgi:hypothetical protein